MKPLTLILFGLLITTTSLGQYESDKQIFKSPNLKEVKSQIKSVAILPFDVTINYKHVPKNMTPELKKEEEEKWRTEMQNGLFTFLFRKQNDYKVSIQDIERTNAILKRAKIFDKEALVEILPDSLAVILGVDAVIKGKWDYTTTHSEGAAIAKAFLLMNSSTATGTCTLNIYYGKTGELLWRFYKEMNEGISSDANDVMERMMRKVGRNFPLDN